jgi:WD40 repeat protein
MPGNAIAVQLILFSIFHGLAVQNPGQAFVDKASWKKGNTPILSMALSDDGKLLALACFNGKIQVYQAESGKLVNELKSSDDPAFCVMFLPKGDAVISGHESGLIQIWKIDQSRPEKPISNRGTAILAISRNLDGSFFATGDANGQVKIWECAKSFASLVIYQDKKAISALVFSSDARTIFIAGVSEEIVICDYNKGSILAKLKGHRAEIRGLAMSPDGKKRHFSLNATGL